MHAYWDEDKALTYYSLRALALLRHNGIQPEFKLLAQDFRGEHRRGIGAGSSPVAVPVFQGAPAEDAVGFPPIAPATWGGNQAVDRQPGG